MTRWSDTMVGWASEHSRSYAAYVRAGQVNADLDRMHEVIEEAQKVVEETRMKRCPRCGKPLEYAHVHDGIRYSNAVPWPP